ncbi:hypothetical protein FACS1894116_03970 [Betaproteobacteria bacterium]|nr:hypothetical protein FACS1894116_03970 [Betaproteobacteria bacterium]GHU22549.1 hypothetical protein FACS189488_03320 [Betaproteobacteria bacterium]
MKLTSLSRPLTFAATALVLGSASVAMAHDTPPTHTVLSLSSSVRHADIAGVQSPLTTPVNATPKPIVPTPEPEPLPAPEK